MRTPAVHAPQLHHEVRCKKKSSSSNFNHPHSGVCHLKLGTAATSMNLQEVLMDLSQASRINNTSIPLTASTLSAEVTKLLVMQDNHYQLSSSNNCNHSPSGVCQLRLGTAVLSTNLQEVLVESKSLMHHT